MNPIRPSRYICKQCTTKLQLKPTHRRPLTTSARPLLQKGFARLSTRRLLAVHGQDAAHFLQGLTTQNIPTSGLLSSPSSPQVLYSAFMNAQGRLLHDVFIYPLHPQHALRERVIGNTDANSTSAPAFLIEVDAEQCKALHAFLRKYKLRAKVAIRQVEEAELGVYSAWTERNRDGNESGDGIASGEATLAQLLRKPMANSGLLVAPDPRIPEPWSRVLAPDKDVSPLSEDAALPQVHESVYTLQRYLNGVPEGQKELPREDTLLHEADVDLMQGVDFRKGCYVGQELVIRTQHTGVIRKRVMPIQIWTGEQPSAVMAEQEEPAFGGDLQDYEGLQGISQSCPLSPMIGQNIKTKGAKRPEGKFLGGIGNVGLGLCRLERVVELEDGVAKGKTQMFKVDTSSAGGEMSRTWVRPFVPSWWTERGQIMEGGYESLKARAPGRKS